eukprot:SAG22_NODE_5445_length_1013_cov_0.834792_2_plen_122_part_01
MSRLLVLGAAAAAVAALLPHAQPTSGQGPEPPDASESVVAVVALRPAYLPGIRDKDTADIGGNIFFWLKDRILHPMHCRRNPSWGQCASGPLLYADNVFGRRISFWQAAVVSLYRSLGGSNK